MEWSTFPKALRLSRYTNKLVKSKRRYLRIRPDHDQYFPNVNNHCGDDWRKVLLKHPSVHTMLVDVQSQAAWLTPFAFILQEHQSSKARMIWRYSTGRLSNILASELSSPEQELGVPGCCCASQTNKRHCYSNVSDPRFIVHIHDVNLTYS